MWRNVFGDFGNDVTKIEDLQCGTCLHQNGYKLHSRNGGTFVPLLIDSAQKAILSQDMDYDMIQEHVHFFDLTLSNNSREFLGVAYK